ncbi:MAG: molybdopterin-dependent oxidoreductase [Firmicutes bacterium]|nr:molybdopterin-dependent oxidoreductase [Bacillota bacterium]
MANPSIAPAKQPVEEDLWIPSVCYMCYNSCRIRVHRVNGVIVGIEGNPGNPNNGARVCAKGRAGFMSCYNPQRLTKPLKRTNPQKGFGVDPGFVEITWEEAMDTVVEKLKEVRAKDPRALMFATFDTHILSTYVFAWIGAFGSHNFTAGAAGWFCGASLHPITWLFHGSFYPVPDLDHARYLMVFGTQKGHGMSVNPMHESIRMAEAKAKGLHLTVVDPWLNQTAACAQEWVPLRPGTDGALALGILNELLNELGIFDREFIRRHTNGPYLIGPDQKFLRDQDGRPLLWDPCAGQARPLTEVDEFEPAIEGSYEIDGVTCRTGFQILKDHVRSYPAGKVAEITTVPAGTVRRLAREMGEAARIGSTIVVDGVELPHRPASACYNRGISQHKHGMLTALAIQLINVVLGAMDVPGGAMGILSAGPNWLPEADEDGMLVPSPLAAFMGVPYPLRPAPPRYRIQSLEIKELFPLSNGSRPMLIETLLDHEKYGLPYKLEVLIQCRNNFLMNTADPRKIAEAFARIPFHLSFAQTIDETVEFADIILPDAHYLEGLVPLPERTGINKVVGSHDWCHALRQPVVDPPESVRNWHEILFELAERLGFREEFNRLLNEYLQIKGEFALDPAKQYTVEEFSDRLLMSRAGAANGLETLREKGYAVQAKPVQAAYPRPFTRGRMPLYVETFVVAGERIRRGASELGLDFWETADFQPVPDWRPCHAHTMDSREFDLWVINYKMPYHSFSYTAENPWLNELTDLHPHHRGIIINAETARRKGLNDGDWVWLESSDGLKVKGQVYLRQGIHPEVLATAGIQGHWGRGRPEGIRGKGVHFNALVHFTLKNLDYMSGALDACVKVKIVKAN